MISQHPASYPYTLKATPENIHFGFYSADLNPVLTIRSGDEVEIETSRAVEIYSLWRSSTARA